MKEIWKDIVGYKGLYQVSNMGQVRSLPRPKCFTDKNHLKANLKGTLLKPVLASKKGYHSVGLWKDSKRHHHYIHRLVLENFIGMDDSRKTVNHKNGICTDNRLDNLEWLTHGENQLHAYRVLNRSIVSCDGERDGNAKLTWKAVDIIRKLRAKNPKRWTCKVLAERFGVTPAIISHAATGRTWKRRPQPIK